MPYASKFTAIITDCRAGGGRYGVVLDHTPFHDGTGGQPPDRGSIGGLDVLDVCPDGGKTVHTLAAALEVGRTVECVLDVRRNFLFRQHHTAEHIFSGIVAARYGFANVGFHIGAGGPVYATLDFNGEWPPGDTPVLEQLVNQAVWENVPVTERLARPDDAYRSKRPLDGGVRLVTVEGYDACACCGSHVRATGEIGAVKIAGCKRHKGGLRVTILCGARALEDYAAKQELLRGLCAGLSATEASLPDRVGELLARTEALGAEAAKLRMKLFERHIRGLERQEPLPWLVWEDAERAELAHMAAALNGMVLLPKEGGGYYAAIASENGRAKELAAGIVGSCGGKGGGGPTLWQGSIERLP
jgi:alanyl-tRNA synthetase